MMKNINLRRLLSAAIAIVLVASLAAPINADAANLTETPVSDKVINVDPSDGETAQPMTDGYTYWKITSTKVVSKPYGSWRDGPSGSGPATLTFSQSNSKTYNIGVKNTISGSYSNIATIAAELGVTIGITAQRETSYSVVVPKGKRYQILYRPHYKRYKVVETQYQRLDGVLSIVKTQTSYVNVFSNWDYTWKSI